MSSCQSELPPGEGSHVFRGFMSDDLEQFQSSRQKYVGLEAARSVIRELVSDENNPNNSDGNKRASGSSHVKFNNTSKALVNEIFELQSGKKYIIIS